MLKSAARTIVAWTAISGLALIAGDAIANATCPQVGFTIVEPHASPKTRPIWVGNKQVIYVLRMPITRTKNIVEIKLGGNDYDAEIQLKFTPTATKKLIDATSHAGFAIYVEKRYRNWCI